MALISHMIKDQATKATLLKPSVNLLPLTISSISYLSSLSRRRQLRQSSTTRSCPLTCVTCPSQVKVYNSGHFNLILMPVTVSSLRYSSSHRCQQINRRFSISTQDDERKLQCVLDYWAQQLQSQNIDEPDISTNYIVAHVLGHKTIHDVDRNKLLTTIQVEKIKELCQLRLTSMPVQYVIGEWDFLNLTLKMRSPVLIPRPETEELAVLCTDTLLQDSDAQHGTILEIGCGSGALSLSLLHKFPKLHVVAVDVSETACSLTSENAERLGVKDRIQIIHGDFCSEKVLLELGQISPFPLIVSNPPYLSTNEIPHLQLEIKCFEDHVALDGGQDGLEIVREIILKSVNLLKDDGHLWLEVSQQHPPLIANFVKENLHCSLSLTRIVKDLFGKDRFCHLQKKSLKQSKQFNLGKHNT